tara:strand:- start:4932 stop:6362 length:1431 start_codon:yes stop_codon:yes gene_type:complete
VLIAHLRAKVELRRKPHLRKNPTVIIDRSLGEPVIVDYFPSTSGVVAGMPLEEALSQHPSTTILEADEPSYRRVFQQTLQALEGISDRVEKAELGTAYIGIDGLEALHSSEAALLHTLRKSIPHDLSPQIGVAEAKFPAFVAARTGRGSNTVTVPANASRFLAPRSIDLLPLPKSVRQGLLQFGLHSMGAVATMLPELLIDQFGNEGRRAWELCQGIDKSPLIPTTTEETVPEHITLPLASTSLELMLTGVDALLRRAFSRPTARGRYASRIDIACQLHGSPPWEKTFHFRTGIGRWEDASSSIRRLLENDHPEAPIEEIFLKLTGLSEGMGEQIGLFPDMREGLEPRLLEVERQLQSRLDGNPALYRMTPIAPWHPAPEMRVVQMPIDPLGREGMRALSLPNPVAVKEDPEGQPIAVKLKYGWHQVTHIEEHWTFDLWWLPAPLCRAYYRVSHEDGQQVTLFRDQHENRWYQQAC